MRAADTELEGWNHNTHYHDYLLSFVPRKCERALDVGCGTGSFARRLSGVAASVEAIDTDAGVVRMARELSPGFSNVRFIKADMMTWSGDGTYDFISLIASLHHMPLADALAKTKRLLRTGGVLAVLGLYRTSSPLDGGRSLLAWPVSMYHRATRRAEGVVAPIAEPDMTLPEIAFLAREMLPGATIKRHLLWRYSLIWTKV